MGMTSGGSLSRDQVRYGVAILFGLVLGLIAYTMVYPSVNGGEAETISDDPNFSVFSAMEVDNPSSTPILEYGWNTNDTIEAGPWAREGFGEKVSGSDLFDTEEDGFILHAWTPSLGSGKWFPSNVSQSVQIPETVENARVVMRGKSAAYLLKNISRDTCKDTEMRLTVIPSQGQPIQKTTVVSYDMENLTIDVSDYVGEEIGIVGGTMPYDGSQCEGGTNYLYIDSLFVERIR